MLSHSLTAQHVPVLAAALPLAGWALHARTLARRLDAARRDPLTGLVTRGGFEKTARRLLRHPDAVVVFVDLDDFKPINDRYGHAAGDQALIATAEVLRRFATPWGIAARLGGDEFAVIRPLPTKHTRFTMGRLLAYPPFLTLDDGTELIVRGSLGVARVAELPVPSLSAALAAADAAMYEAKQQGGSRWVLARTDHMHPAAQRRWDRNRPASADRSAA